MLYEPEVYPQWRRFSVLSILSFWLFVMAEAVRHCECKWSMIWGSALVGISAALICLCAVLASILMQTKLLIWKHQCVRSSLANTFVEGNEFPCLYPGERNCFLSVLTPVNRKTCMLNSDSYDLFFIAAAILLMQELEKHLLRWISCG